MLEEMNYRLKNRLLLIAVPLLLVAGYFFAFNRTYSAIKLHRQLNEQIDRADNLSSNPKYAADKLSAVNAILDQYKVDTTAWREDFWMTASDMASEKSISVSYEQKKASFDSGKVNPVVADLEIRFAGKYLDLIQLIDSLEQSNKLGLLAGIDMKSTNTGFDRKEKNILVKAKFKVISK